MWVMSKIPPEIRILPDDVANKIAAGEVIERPAAVVKELLENSIDAGATRIEIEFKHGGKSFIKISDNGCGMTREQALTSLELHATSKISTPDDIFKISTYGFRGEAVPSIASVSKFTMRTRPSSSQIGTQIEVFSGEVKSVRDCGMAEGTEIVVENLFCGVPARRKFLKSDNVEASHITKLCRMYALALPELAITLIENSRVIFMSERNPNMIARVSRVCGRDVAANLVELKTCQLDDMKLYGAILAPAESFATSRNICTFINSRPVECKAVYSAIKEAYEPYIPKGKFAAAFLFLGIDPTTVDVNVHPAKREVRLKDETKIRDFICEALSRKLRACTATPSTPNSIDNYYAPPPPLKEENQVEQKEAEKIFTQNLSAHSAQNDKPKIIEQVRTPPRAVITPTQITPPAPITPKATISPKVDAQEQAVQETSSALKPNSALDDWRYLACFKKRFAIFETRRGLVMMSISAALKRVHYARIISSLLESKADAQNLLLPITLKFERADDEVFAANKDAFTACGFTIENFGLRMYKVEAIPAWLSYERAEAFIRGFVEEGRDEGTNIRKRKLADDTFAKLAVKRMGAANFTCNETSAFALLNELLSCDFHSTSPDGKPTLKEISESEISKMFGI